MTTFRHVRVLREAGSTRLRASLRGVLPAVATLVMLLAGLLVLRLALGSGTDESPVRAILAQFAVMLLYLGLVAAGLRAAARLDRRQYGDFGLDVDARWVSNFAAGAVISVVGVALSMWWGQFRGFVVVDVAAAGVDGPGGPLVHGAMLVAFTAQFLAGNLYEEVVYRAIVLRNFAEGLTARGFSPAWAVVPATAASLLLFGLYHVPLRGNLVVAVDAALVGVTFALAYLLTGELGLPVGVHFGRISFELVTGWEFGPFEVPAVVEYTRESTAAFLEVKGVRLGLVCLFVLGWVYLRYGEVRLAETTHTGGPADR